MADIHFGNFHKPPQPPRRDGPPPLPHPAGRAEWVRRIVVAALVFALGYGLYFWEIRRIVVPPGHVLVLLKKNGSRSLPGEQIIVPRPPDPKDPKYAQKLVDWEKSYGDCNGVLEQVAPEGTYFGYSPWDYEREVIDISDTAIVPANKVGIVIKRFGQKLDTDEHGQAMQVLADPARDQRGPLPIILRPGRYNEYANPYAYEIKQIEPVEIDPGFRGVVAVMAGHAPQDPNQYLVNDAEQGVQRRTEPEGFRYVNPYERRIVPISIQSQRFEMINDLKTGVDDSIRFPSADSFDIRLDGFVEWSIIPDKLPLIYTQYGTGGQLIPYLQEKVILPYARSFCRLVGSQYNARDFISGDTKLKFQEEFERRLREACEKQGIEVLQALVRNIEPPDAIKQPINDREIAKEQILQYQQQIKVAQSQAKLATQEQMASQNKAIGEANKDVVTITKKAEQEAEVAVTKAQQELEVAKLRVQAAEKQADALIARGQAEASIILLKKKAEAEPLRQQVQAFGGGDDYARYFFYLKVAPAVKSIMTNTDGPFADLFKQFVAPPRTRDTREPAPKVTDAQH